MLHEATHQLARQLSGFRRNRWIDEGLASYFSTRRLGDTGLQVGATDAQAYRQFLAQGSTLDAFVSLIGPVEKIQAEWYAYLQAQSLSQPSPFPLP
jgi:hypothetical protein